MRERLPQHSSTLDAPSPLAGEGGAKRRVRGLAAFPRTMSMGKQQSPLTHPPSAGALSRQGRGQKAASLAVATTAALCLAPTAAWAAAAGASVDPFMFRLAIFVGYYVVWSVTPALHTPLMSVTNAISSVIVVGALLAVGVEHAAGDLPQAIEGATASKIFGFLALAMAAVNIFGGFLVTQRMLAMYKKKEKK